MTGSVECLQHAGCLKRMLWGRRFLATAVVHFIGSGSVNRALRYWARTHEEAVRRARQCQPDANGFKLSDYGLVPIKRKPAVRTGASYKNEEDELGLPLEVHTESDIFQALGLSYVPPHMRFFGPDFE